MDKNVIVLVPGSVVDNSTKEYIDQHRHVFPLFEDRMLGDCSCGAQPSIDTFRS